MNFCLSEKEVATFKAWNEKHLAERHNGKEPYCGAVGGRLTFDFTPTSLGTVAGVKCVCGASETLTDWDNFG